jgi:hypothetical protein
MDSFKILQRFGRSTIPVRCSMIVYQASSSARPRNEMESSSLVTPILRSERGHWPGFALKTARFWGYLFTISTTGRKAIKQSNPL